MSLATNVSTDPYISGVSGYKCSHSLDFCATVILLL